MDTAGGKGKKGATRRKKGGSPRNLIEVDEILPHYLKRTRLRRRMLISDNSNLVYFQFEGW
ncbi:hypothetical protein BVRB_3g049900 [Beta vulgaris subsp. vulgaris]|nr:hypothetical protein BVRB_3g049900 [Beta vulgaris subsp. vulgaris]